MQKVENIHECPACGKTAVSCWVAFDWNKIETRPTEYGKYLICRKDGKIHWETWNGSGWASIITKLDTGRLSCHLAANVFGLCVRAGF